MKNIQSIDIHRSDALKRAGNGNGLKVFITPESTKSYREFYGSEQTPNFDMANEIIAIAMQALGMSRRNIRPIWSQKCGCPCGCSPGFDLHELDEAGKASTPKGLEFIDVKITI